MQGWRRCHGWGWWDSRTPRRAMMASLCESGFVMVYNGPNGMNCTDVMAAAVPFKAGLLSRRSSAKGMSREENWSSGTLGLKVTREVAGIQQCRT